MKQLRHNQALVSVAAWAFASKELFLDSNAIYSIEVSFKNFPKFMIYILNENTSSPQHSKAYITVDQWKDYLWKSCRDITYIPDI